jgi:ABC-2 type transport system ATP-binding protein
MTESSVAVKVKNLTKSYGVGFAIRDLNFEVHKGEILGFLGPNGAGKSTTMKIITGFMPSSDGQVEVVGHDIFDDPIAAKRQIGYLPEIPPLYGEMVVEDYVDFAARIQGVEKSNRKRAVTEALDKTGLGHIRGRLIGNLSKGNKQRVGLAQAIVHNPKVLILDEPTVGFDPEQVIKVRDLIRSFSGEHTVIFSSHILSEVQAVCKRVVVINKGTIVAEDSISNLSSHMQGVPSFQIAVRDTSDQALQKLRAVTGVVSVEKTMDGFVIKGDPTTAGENLAERLIEEAVQQKLGIREFTRHKLSLEDVFLQLTRQA